MALGGGVVTALEVLKAARELISRPEAWTQGVWARDASGEKVLSTSREAVCWCALGAVTRSACNALEQEVAFTELRQGTTGFGGIGDFNDQSSHGEVLALFDRAIVRLEAA